MDKSKNFERTLPEGYVLKKHVDAKRDGGVVLVYALLSLVPLLIIVPAMFLIAHFCSGYNVFAELGDDYPVAMIVLVAVMVAYIVLHELVHGVTYKMYTGGKLTFGITLTVAFCGVPDLYVRRKASIAALVMPFIVFSVLFGGLTAGLYFVNPFYGILASVMLAIHLGGCVGDLHWTLMYLTKFKGCDTLMRDTGPEQWLYVYDREEYDRQKAMLAPVVDTVETAEGEEIAPAEAATVETVVEEAAVEEPASAAEAPEEKHDDEE